ncbi:MAG TPA: rhodanese-like domain-containing protein [Sphingopyxis sp.]|nr:rhodanese-like domain-containing protein [Sphingopyxis sp.]HMP46395.1 rhodanese-like domain-containing protein [Sphingopyxis sp.]
MRPMLLAAALFATPALAQSNPQIDYPGFQALTAAVAPERAQRLLAFDAFRAEAAKPGVLLLDARSRDAFAAGHIAGAVNLPLTDFTADSLAALIGPDPNRPILIYCNNNFANDRPPVPVKAAPLALNIQTFINLVGYGYSNVRELADVVDFDDPKVGWVKG